MQSILVKEDILGILAENKTKLEKEFDVKNISLFGSVARGESTADSDLDILVAFHHKSNADHYFGLQFFLEDLFQCKVDLVTENALRSELKSAVEKELIHV